MIIGAVPLSPGRAGACLMLTSCDCECLVNFHPVMGAALFGLPGATQVAAGQLPEPAPCTPAMQWTAAAREHGSRVLSLLRWLRGAGLYAFRV